MSEKTILVTGATGLVGNCVVRKLHDAGYRVQAMVRHGSKRDALESLGVELVEGDLADVETLPAVVQNAEVVVHAAAHIGDWGPAEKYRAINVAALEHLLNAAMHTDKFERWIQISSLGVYPAQHHYGTDETTPPSLSGLDGYTRTKAEAEVLIRQHIEEDGLRAVILRPGFIYGPGERHSIPRVMEKLEDGTMKFIGPGDKLLNNTYVGNLADAVLLAIQSEAAIGETFNIRDERLVTREEYINTIADYLDKPHPKHVPEWLARLLVGPIERFAKRRGATEAPLLTQARIKFMTLNLDYSIAKAKRVLGYEPQVDFREGILEALDDLTGKRRSADEVSAAN
ncbi:NAD-dependent epimerase/dehydratase family protein [Aeoliella sp. ICT_H6.2]|uniref:NAD-dependent epimerase/dehydratase family protein n=1 Tax=Aeoliella straminimaris TaxID=2954799 RepID=A0A9X2F924_9BACT|nr:NAD-dependent epimerase/dehydratase family protein [Aeoliella straminimaris]